ncbi:putative Membrane protein [uncultured Pleomorphomonas sp.]|uniref:Putative Membrane protein n=1 Tax=uncultured Pleomorphomonas sp. TaxID=442121 RepID=A0A212L952_9HYPH|nr:DUF4405 domain-containing protein [uncultured Pleomorphomonas sp.]SCM74007.1 putative Membrane protein [uncultured Pleomorphomonas sp.]
MSAKETLFRYATPLTTWLFLISLVSGVALFFHVGNRYFHAMHEILSMALIVPFGLHVWRNWRTLMGYFRRSAMWISTAVCLAAAVAFAYAGAGEGRGGGNPRMAAFGALNNASVTALAALARTDEATVTGRLEAIGVEVTSAEDTVAGLARASGRDGFELLNAALAPAQAGGRPAP